MQNRTQYQEYQFYQYLEKDDVSAALVTTQTKEGDLWFVGLPGETYFNFITASFPEAFQNNEMDAWLAWVEACAYDALFDKNGNILPEIRVALDKDNILSKLENADGIERVKKELLISYIDNIINIIIFYHFTDESEQLIEDDNYHYFLELADKKIKSIVSRLPALFSIEQKLSHLATDARTTSLRYLISRALLDKAKENTTEELKAEALDALHDDELDESILCRKMNKIRMNIQDEPKGDNKKNPILLDFINAEARSDKANNIRRLLESGNEVFDKRGRTTQAFEKDEVYYITGDDGHQAWFTPLATVIRHKRKHGEEYNLSVTDKEYGRGATAQVNKVLNERATHSRVVKAQNHQEASKGNRRYLDVYLPPEAALKEKKYGRHLHVKEIIYNPDKSRSYAVMDDAGISLQNMITANKEGEFEITDEERLLLAIGVAKAYHYQIHTQAIVHQDVKPANILIDFDNLHQVLNQDPSSRAFPVKFADLSTVKKVGDKTLFPPVVPGYTAPEVYSDIHPTTSIQSDLYSLGVIEAVIFNNDEPSISMVWEEYSLTNLLAGMDLDETQGATIEVLLTQMLQQNPKLRPDNAKDLIHVLTNIYAEKYGITPSEEATVSTAKTNTVSNEKNDKGFFEEHTGEIAGPTAAGALLGAGAGAGAGVAISLGAIPFTFGLSAFALPVVIVITTAVGAGAGALVGFTVGMVWAASKHFYNKWKSKPVIESREESKPEVVVSEREYSNDHQVTVGSNEKVNERKEKMNERKVLLSGSRDILLPAPSNNMPLSQEQPEPRSQNKKLTRSSN